MQLTISTNNTILGFLKARHMADEYIFRQAQVSDIEAITLIMRQAVAQMLREGKQQWNEHYPTATHIGADINKGCGYVLANAEGDIVCYGAAVYSGEPAYDTLEGEWLSDLPYVVVHRIAVADGHKRRGLSTVFFRHVERQALARGVHSFRIDTNYDNIYMQKVLTKCGFALCGTVRYPQGERLAYEKLL